METVFKVLLSTITLTLFGCRNSFSELPAHKILLFKDKFGIYTYDPKTKDGKEVYEAAANEIFLPEPIKVSGDTLVFAVKGELQVSIQNNRIEHYTKKFYSLTLSNKHSSSLKLLTTLLKAVK
jgi:hypothetical protein